MATERELDEAKWQEHYARYMVRAFDDGELTAEQARAAWRAMMETLK